jgi:hypothetical protein
MMTEPWVAARCIPLSSTHIQLVYALQQMNLLLTVYVQIAGHAKFAQVLRSECTGMCGAACLESAASAADVLAS